MKDNSGSKPTIIKERIKTKPINKRRLLQRILVTAIVAVSFGIISSVVIVLAVPAISEQVYPTKEKKIEIDTPEESINFTSSFLNPSDGTGTLPSIGDISTNDMQKFYYDLFNVGIEARSSLVQISGGKKRGTFVDSDTFDIIPISGIIISKDDNEVTVLCEQNILWEGIDAKVTFNDGTKVSAVVQGFDEKTGLSVLRIRTSIIPQETRAGIEAVKFGTSRALSLGKIVVAVGTPLEKADSVLVGHVTLSTEVVAYVDGQCDVLETNMVAKDEGGGFFLDADGNLIGIITHDNDVDGETHTLAAIGISDITLLVEKLANGEDIPYIGIRAQTIDKEIANQKNLPQGVYVTSVVSDSPAMKAGIQKGDVIIKFGKTELTSARQFMQILETYKPGDAVSFNVKRYSSTGYKSADSYVTIATKSTD